MKHSQEFLNKRRLMVFVPMPGIICLTVLFYLGGGGQGVTAAAAAGGPGTSGLNLTLPSAGKTVMFADKMEASKAPQDSSRRNNLAFVPTITETTTRPRPDSAAPGAGGLNYAVQPGQQATRYEASADPNVVAMQSRMQRLQQQTSTAPAPTVSAPAPSAPAARPAPAASSRPAAPATAAQDPRLDESLQELSALKSQYQQRLLALNSGAVAPAAPPVASTPAKSSKVMSVISRAPRSVVSSLTQTAPQTNGFHTLGAASPSPTLNAVPAVIHSDQVVENGSTVKMRLLEDVQLEGHLIPRNSFLYGVCSISGNRLNIQVTNVQYQGSLLPVSLKAFDIDGGEGLNVPGSVNRDALKQGAATGVSGVDMLAMSPSLGAQAAGIAIQTGKALTGRQIKSVKIHLKANYQLLLKS